ncbi:cyclopropane-fatty-acyl-phospholipid synthase [Pseudogulbenkiania sp. NH8B]|uniref:SAM-dependent methyltransferase n=1 Tax=Pseudogulbenkiania sp. (strain NH8B) TaxID=748280 RepID=UPI000227A4B8|nr:cyclopropane-fatty-acyl-phospholipid synthase family protein [Pseudogulbenkiania sp. NH8B]BAK78780.1 cyclopropane-fatty-acyl-phospholipid synthase [Pseudogulbenkiania sp. NH8B]
MLEHTLAAPVEAWVKSFRHHLNLPVAIVLPSGQSLALGDFEQPRLAIRVRSWKSLPLLLSPSVDHLATAYVEGELDLDGTLDDIIELGYAFALAENPVPGASFQPGHVRHTRELDREAIRFHYNVSNRFYAHWLDRDMVYSCAYFAHGNETLEEAQHAKIRHILTKIRLQPGHTLLDIGCGWGALVRLAAREFGARCVGITLSEAQYEHAVERVRQEGLQRQVEIRLQDYRDVDGRFDRLTSVGMFEHVGLSNLVDYFGTLNRLLVDGGLALNHGITTTSAASDGTAGGGGDFIERYVFPHGELPHISLVLRTLQEGGLEPIDVESLRRHYAVTLAAWASRFEAAREAIRQEVDEKTWRIWRLYLAGCAYAFRTDKVSIFQVLCQKAGQDAATLAWSRDYMYRGR